MRRSIVAIGAGLVLALGLTAASAASNEPAGAATASTPPASGPDWCGFKAKAGSRVRCGYSTRSDCKQAVGEPDAICILDPYLT